MLKTKKQRKPLSLQPETIRRLAVVELGQVVGGMMVRTIPCSVPCTDICSSGL